MNEDDLRRALDGLYAYDQGSVDSGIRDEDLRARVIEELRQRRELGTWRQFLARLVREMWLSDEAIEEGYGTEDLLQFTLWLEDRMHTMVA